MIQVTNDEFTRAIFGQDAPSCHVNQFPFDPGNIPPNKQLISWKGDYYSRSKLTPGYNQYFCISTFYRDEQGDARRRKALYRQTHCLVLDDVVEKLSKEEAQKLPAPSWILETSEGSEQWGYILSQPETVASRIDNLNDGLIASDLAPSGKDPGMRGVTRLVRLPEGSNNKVSKLVNGKPFKCRTLKWQPFNTVTMEQLAEPFSVDLNRSRRESRVDGAADVTDHPLLHTAALNIKEVRSAGRFDITCPWVREHTDGVDNGAAVFTNEDGTLGFKCHHGACDGRTGKDLLDYVETAIPGFRLKLKQWQMFRELPDVSAQAAGAAPPPPSETAEVSPLSKLRAMTVNGEVMMNRMSEDVFVLHDIALRGQWTIFFAGPGTGKTLMILHLLREAIVAGGIDGADVFYLNVDDTARSGAEKAIMAKEVGYSMLLASENGFKAADIPQLMSELIVTGEAKDKVLIIDTIKKVTDPNDKKLSSKFGAVAREFVAAGGTLICCHHTNKHKGADGKSIHAGTSDLRDDCDCSYVIEHLGSSKAFDGSEAHTVEFENTKMRGDVARSVTFQYTRRKGTGYRALLDSVRRLDTGDADMAKEAATAAEQQRMDAEGIEAVKGAIANEVTTKTAIVEYATDRYSVSHRGVKRVLEKYEGSMWKVEKGEKNASIYSLNEPPKPPVTFL